VSDLNATIANHYGDEELSERLLSALKAAGLDLAALTPDDLRPIDQFHIGGQPSTRELAQLAGLQPGTRVLDVGGGVGGPARTLAIEFGCHVTVLDLSAPFCRAGEMLTERTGLSDRVTFRQGDALALPFEDSSFDLVWTQHSSMNVPDKRRLYAEIKRVLRPGGRLALHEIVAGPLQPVHFPVPWAREPGQSFLVTPETLRNLLRELGFTELAWNDVTSGEYAWFRTALERAAARGGKPALGIHLLLGDDFPEMSRNMHRNLAEGRVCIIQAVWVMSDG
jgi:SAM-dependent methyltransferase